MWFTMEEMIDKIRNYQGKPVSIMEVCGTHTMNIAKYGIKQILPPQVELISGPGCPVCVTPTSYFVNLMEFVKQHSCILASYGDMLKVPFQGTSIQKERSRGLDVRIVYSPLECLKIAKENPKEVVLFLGVGFETTAPLTALLVRKAKKHGIGNLKVAIAHKTILPAIRRLVQDVGSSITALLYPGNVGAIIGAEPFYQISHEYGVKGCVCGFTAEEIISSIYSILYGQVLFSNQYKTIVTEKGNTKALEMMTEIFKPCDSVWRGLGQIKDSGYIFRTAYWSYGIELEGGEDRKIEEKTTCLCGEILAGKKKPIECRYFGKQCTPFTPIGPCMVSNEGTCGAAYTIEI